MRILVVNAGSSSLKVDLVDGGVAVESWPGLPDDAPDVDAVGHRIVHGGPDLAEPVVIDAAVEKRLRELVELAPLHQPKSLAGLDAARALLPGVPHVACFDTAFHATLSPAAATFALPRAWREQWGVRRYGFHGLSHAWSARRAAELAPGCRRVVTCHLGAGASLAAVLDGRSVDTTMGFTPLDGLVMATRSGAVDPGLLLWLEEHEGLRPREVADTLEHASGLLGLAGTADMREILGRDDADARLALEVYLHRLAGGIATMTVALGGLDTLVFTGGVGENAPAVRAGTADRLAHLGVAVDQPANAAAVLAGSRAPDVEVSADGAPVRTLVVRAREDPPDRLRRREGTGGPTLIDRPEVGPLDLIGRGTSDLASPCPLRCAEYQARPMRSIPVDSTRTEQSSTEVAAPSPGRTSAERPVLFVAIAYLLSWSWALALVAAGATVLTGRGWPTHVPSLLGPLLAAVLCSALAGRRSLRALLLRIVRWRIGWRWWLVALSPLFALVVVLGVLWVTGSGVPTWSDFAGFSGLPASWGVLGVAAAIVLVGGIGEETGWRGYLQPALQRRFGPLAATAVVATVWAGWHAPQFFLVRSYEDFPIAMLPIFLVGLAGGSVVLAWLYNSTRSVLACAVWHGLYNVAGATAAASSRGGMIAAAIWTFVVAFAVVLLLADRRARRAGRPSVLAGR